MNLYLKQLLYEVQSIYHPTISAHVILFCNFILYWPLSKTEIKTKYVDILQAVKIIQVLIGLFQESLVVINSSYKINSNVQPIQTKWLLVP